MRQQMDLEDVKRIAATGDFSLIPLSGAGIVADSVPENEFTECINKAKAVVEAIKNAGDL